MEIAALLERVERLEAEAQIRDVAARYCWGADHRDLPTWESVWAPDAVWQVRPDLAFTGIDQIRAAVQRQWASIPRMLHATSNHRVEVDGDSAAGVADVVVMVQLGEEHGEGTGSWVSGGGVYRDEYVRLDGRWSLRRREAAETFLHGPAAPLTRSGNTSPRRDRTSTVQGMATEGLVPADFVAPTTLVTERFRLEPLGPQHNESDLRAWTSSVAHIRATPGYPDGSWPPLDGMPPEENLADLTRHAEDFAARKGFTFTVLDPAGGEVIGCVYLYPPEDAEHDVSVQSWVSADHAELDTPLADAVAAWIRTDWPWERPDRYGR
jgi:RimJ/RimL family protein N-acetyltransferase/ketosteroid isomerase-like protein